MHKISLKDNSEITDLKFSEIALWNCLISKVTQGWGRTFTYYIEIPAQGRLKV